MLKVINRSNIFKEKYKILLEKDFQGDSSFSRRFKVFKEISSGIQGFQGEWEAWF